jgi:hypothetical protein
MVLQIWTFLYKIGQKIGELLTENVQQSKRNLLIFFKSG